MTVLALLLLELASLAWSLRTLRRWRRSDAPLPTGRRAVATIALPLVLDALVLYLLLVYLPARFGTPLPVILAFQPDAPLLVWPLLLLAGVWGLVRTVALAVLYLGRRPVRRSAVTTSGA